MSSLISTATARADEPVASTTQPERHIPAEPEPAPAQPQPTAKDVEGAPRPGDESGRLDRVDDGRDWHVARWIARGALFVPKLAVEIGFAPVRGALWADDRYQLEDLYFRTFYNEDRTIGIVPTATYTTGLGGGVGAHFFDTNTFGEQEHASVAGDGGAFVSRERCREDRLGQALRPGPDRGRRQLRSPPQRSVLRHRQQRHREGIARADRSADRFDGRRDLPPVSGEACRGGRRCRRGLLTSILLATGSMTQLRFARSTDGLAIDEVYDPADLVGFDGGVEHADGELELRWDSRRRERQRSGSRPTSTPSARCCARSGGAAICSKAKALTSPATAASSSSSCGSAPVRACCRSGFTARA